MSDIQQCRESIQVIDVTPLEVAKKIELMAKERSGQNDGSQM